MPRLRNRRDGAGDANRMTRDDICISCEHRTAVERGAGCAGSGATRACDLVTCASDPDLPSPSQYERMMHDPAAMCRHPDGDRWAGIEPEPMPILPPMASPGLLVLRARACKGCAEHYVNESASWGCTAIGDDDIRRLVTDPAGKCPLGKWPERVTGDVAQGAEALPEPERSQPGDDGRASRNLVRSGLPGLIGDGQKILDDAGNPAETGQGADDAQEPGGGRDANV